MEINSNPLYLGDTTEKAPVVDERKARQKAKNDMK